MRLQLAVESVLLYVKPGRPEVPPEVVKLQLVTVVSAAFNVKKPVTLPPSSNAIGERDPTGSGFANAP
jgi:hypothetical protein